MTTNDLVRAYREAQEHVLREIRRLSALGNVTEYQEQLLLEIHKVLESLGVDNGQWLRDNVPQVYRQTQEKAYQQVSMLPQREAAPAFGGIHRRAVQVIVDNAVSDFSRALDAVGRHIEDQVRAAGVQAVQKGLTTGQTVREMARMLEKTLAEQGHVLGVTDSRDRYMPADAYAEMAARTITRETTNTATIHTGHALDMHLFKVSKHFPTCKLCAPRQDRVYRDIDFPDGDERNRFPHISMAFPNWPEYKTIHPRCRHILMLVSWDALSRETQLKYLADAEIPFDLDPRSEKEIRAYNESQSLHRRMREDRKQWRRYQQRLGEHVPKSFSAFRRVKKANGRSWGILQAKYKAMGQYERAVAQEPAITQAVQQVAAGTAMETAGLGKRVKTKDSFLQKVESNFRPEGNAYEVKDILRYTLTAPPEALADKTLESIVLFESMGYNTSAVKNYWLKDDNPYNGINAVLVSPSGQKIEVQYHTPESFALKNGAMHALYEKQRVLKDQTSQKALELRNAMFDLSDGLQRPTDIEKVKSSEVLRAN